MHGDGWSGAGGVGGLADRGGLRGWLDGSFGPLVERNPLPAGLKARVLQECGASAALRGRLGDAPGCQPHEEVLLRLAPSWLEGGAKAAQRRELFRQAVGPDLSAWLAVLAWGAAARVLAEAEGSP